MAEQPATPKDTVVLIHGLWMTPLCWEEWISYLESKGYEVIAPGWPGIDDRSPQDIRADPQPIASATIEKIVDHYASLIEALPSPPIIIGHSFGGLFTQILLSRGLGRAGIALSPAQPAGIFSLPFSTVKATFPVLKNPFDMGSTVKITENQFHYCFGNHLAPAESKTLWDRYSIPSVAHVLWEGALGGLKAKGPAHVDFRRECRAPLLLVAGTNDHVVPKSTVEKEFAAYDKTGQAVVELKVFEGRTHGIVNQEGWKEVADYGIEFALKHTKS
ncbi:alpha/beta-hydrolase [Thozetella sp. PMI_491]|nr:alpha/beta-hydrolase [Thozetella sp. PMI_491]